MLSQIQDVYTDIFRKEEILLGEAKHLRRGAKAVNIQKLTIPDFEVGDDDIFECGSGYATDV